VKSDTAGVSQQLSSLNENILEQYAGGIAGIFYHTPNTWYSLTSAIDQQHCRYLTDDAVTKCRIDTKKTYRKM
jgi:hypothetical protein